MAIPASLKFDVRVRERLLEDGVLSDSEVKKHLEALTDVESQAVDMTLKQPALQNESDRDIVIVRTSGARPVAPIRPTDDDLPIPDDDDLDDDDDDDVKPEKKVVAEKVVEKVVEKPKAAAVVEDADDDDDEDDEDEDEEEAAEAKEEAP